MALLDTFRILFEADTSKMDRGLNKAEQSTDDLVESMKEADAQADKTTDSFRSMTAKLVGWLAGAVAASQAVTGAIGRAEQIMAISRTADALGMATEEVDAFGRAAEMMGGDAQGARDSLTDMAESMGEAMADVESGRAKTFAALGVSLLDVNGKSKTAMQGMLDLASAVESMPRGQAVFRIKELGITDNRTVEMILKGRRALEDMLRPLREQSTATKEAKEQAEAFQAAMHQTRVAVGSLTDGFYQAILPALGAFVEWIGKAASWARDNQDFIVGFFGAIAAVVAVAYLPGMIAAAAATLAATWPLIAMGAAVAALAALFALAYDDVMTFIECGDSLTGRVIPEAMAAFKALGDLVMGIWSGITYAWDAFIAKIMSGVDKVRGVARSVGGVLGFDTGEAGQGVAAGSAAMTQAAGAPTTGMSSAAISNRIGGKRETNVSIGEVKVQTQATDSNGISRSIGGSLNDQLKRLQTSAATGMER
jgi:hypothetical protein